MLPVKLSLTVAGSMIDLLFTLWVGRRRSPIVPVDIGRGLAFSDLRERGRSGDNREKFGDGRVC